MSPDLEVVIRSAALTRTRARAIVAEVRLLDRCVPIGTHGIRSPGLDLWAHDVLDTDADWDAEEWKFDPAEVDRLENALRRVSELLPEEFTLEACWGDRSHREVALTRDELLKLLSENRLGNRVLYRVSAQGGG
jgi:hypothetical protein